MIFFTSISISVLMRSQSDLTSIRFFEQPHQYREMSNLVFEVKFAVVPKIEHWIGGHISTVIGWNFAII